MAAVSAHAQNVPPVVAPPAPAPKAATPPTEAKAADADKPEGSEHVRCDGYPRKESPAEVTARILAITATAGIVGGMIGAPETANVSRRLEGADGVDACVAALGKEHDPQRRAELTFAMSVHHLEAKQDTAALDDATAILATNLGGDGYSRGTGLSFYEVQAWALLRLNRPTEAEAAALKLAQAMPWDLSATLRAAPFLNLTGTRTPQKDAYYDSLARQWPAALSWKAAYKEWYGDFAGAAKDLDAAQDMYWAFVADPDAAVPPVAYRARRSVDYMLAGDMTTSNKLADEARADLDQMVAKGTALTNSNTTTFAQELLDFQAIGRAFSDGKVKEARAAFAARTRWLVASAQEVAALSAQLRKDAPPEELTGGLAIDPAKIRADGLAAAQNAVVERLKKPLALYVGLRPLLRDNDFSLLSRNVRNTLKSPYIAKRTAKDDGKYNGEFVRVVEHYNAVANEAILLHLALVAKSRGKAGFVLLRPTKVTEGLVLFGSPGDPGLPEAAFNDADKIIGALSQDFPTP